MDATFVLQKGILDELYIREDEFKNFLEFIKKYFRDYTLITDFNNEREFILFSEENPLLELLLDKFNQIQFVSDLSNILENKDLLKLSSKRTIVLSMLSDKICNDYLSSHGILFFNLSLLKNWELYSDIILSKSLKVTKDNAIPPKMRFVSFKCISRFFKHCDSIVLFDKYVFSNKSNQLLINNLYVFIESILELNEIIDIMIISEFKGNDITKQYYELKKYLDQKGYSKYNLNLVHHCKAFYPRNFEGLHSRFILSNYIHVRSNDSFNFFKENGDFNNLADIDIKFSLTRDNSHSYFKDLQAIREYISRVKNEPKCPKDELKITFYKNKLSALI